MFGTSMGQHPTRISGIIDHMNDDDQRIRFLKWQTHIGVSGILEVQWSVFEHFLALLRHDGIGKRRRCNM